MTNSRLKKNIQKPSCFEVARGALTKDTNMQQVKQDVASEWSILNHLKKDPFFPTKTWQIEPLSQGFHPLDTESYPQSLVLAFLAGWFACWGSLCQNIGTEKSQHGHPFQPLKTLKITRTGLGVSTPIPKFSSLILVGYWWQTPGWRKTSKSPLVLKLQGVPSQKLQRCNRLNRM